MKFLEKYLFPQITGFTEDIGHILAFPEGITRDYNKASFGANLAGRGEQNVHFLFCALCVGCYLALPMNQKCQQL